MARDSPAQHAIWVLAAASMCSKLQGEAGITSLPYTQCQGATHVPRQRMLRSALDSRPMQPSADSHSLPCHAVPAPPSNLHLKPGRVHQSASQLQALPQSLVVIAGAVTGLAKRVIACLDVRANDKGDLVVTKGDQYDVRETSGGRDVRNLGAPVQLASRYFAEGADEVTFLNITGFRDFPLGDMPMLEVGAIIHP